MEKILLDDYLKFKAISNLAWAPGGGKAAFIVHSANEEKNGYNSDLWLWEEGKPLRQLTSAGDVKSFVWDGENAITFPTIRNLADKTVKDRGEDFTVFYTLPLNGGSAYRSFSVGLNGSIIGKLDTNVYVIKARVNLLKAQRLQNLTGTARDTELSTIKEEDSRFVVFDEYPFWFNGMGIINKTRLGLWIYNSANNSLTPITSKLFNVEDATVCPEARKIVYHGCEFEAVSNFKTGIWVYDYATGKNQNVVNQGIYRIRQVDWIDDRVIFAGTDMGEYNYSQTPALWTVDPESLDVKRFTSTSMTIGNPVGSDTRYGGGTCFKVEDGKLYLISGIEDSSRLICINKNGEITPLVEKSGSVDLFDVHKGKILFVAMHDMKLQELYFIKDKMYNRISSFNEDFYQTHNIIHPEELRFNDLDGFEIHGFILKPANFDTSKTYPAILDIHGGPRLSYGPVYYHEMQAWANMGYFVYFANPRGSDSRGDDFAFIRGKYGTVEYQNLMDFTDHVLNTYPQIDKSRLGVAGGSYGGFMTNWIIGHTDRFAAAASQRSISNFISMEGTSDCGRTFVDGHLGTSVSENMLKVWEQSPLSAAHNCTTPTLFIHAEEDYRCWKVEALQMFNAIREKGVDARLCLFKDENHELSRSGKPKNRSKRLREITNWMNKYLNP